MHDHSQSVSFSTAELDEFNEGELRTPSRRGTYSRFETESGASGIPAPSAIPMPSSRRQSGGGATGRRTSSGAGMRESIGSKLPSKLTDVGETY